MKHLNRETEFKNRNYRCKICDYNGNFKFFIARDYNAKNPGKFRYYICPKCGCMQIGKVPGNLSDYYGDLYYSFSGTKQVNVIQKLVQTFKIKRDIYEMGLGGFIGMCMHIFVPRPSYGIIYSLIKPESNILDVGCGDGYFLSILEKLGQKKLCGCDRFITEITERSNQSIKIIKGVIDDCDGQYDLIMFLHSFEHMENPQETLRSAYKKLNDNGAIVISIPIAGSNAFDKFGKYWVQLDAPRHLFIHTKKSIEMMAEKAGLKIERIDYDSTAFQYIGSLQVMRGQTRKEHRKIRGLIEYAILSSIKYNGQTMEDNKNGRSDQATFVLKKQS